MTARCVVLALALCGPWAVGALAQEERAGRPAGRGGPEAAALTEAQKAQVEAILSRYQAASLTAADAKAINEAFRAAGLRNGPGLQEAIREAGFVPERIGELDPAPDRPQGQRPGRPDAPRSGERQRRGGGYSIEQATSDRAQLTTIAFSGLAFLTGDWACSTFLPPGKVADFSGFQYMRDVDRNQLGHNTSFVPRVSNSVLAVLTEGQKAQLVALAREQEPLLTEFAHRRFPLVEAFHRQLAGPLPAGSAGLSRAAVMKYAGELYQIDGQLSFRRAAVLGGILRSLTDAQKARLDEMAFDDSSTWPELPDQADRRSLSHTAHVALTTYASEMFSWYKGGLEADVYFCPERHATYFGSFYMKDIPAMGNPGYSISTSLTGDSGEAFLAALSEPQRQLVTRLVDQQRASLAAIVATRREIATELRRFQQVPAADQAKVLALSKRYGELDGDISQMYAKGFAAVAKTLTADQKAALLRLRNLDARYACKSAYLYSRPIALPATVGTDFLFETLAR
jgi:hypothetical protein